MKVTFRGYLMPKYEAYVEQIRSYCQQMNQPFVKPSISDFLRANALTRDRLTTQEPA